MKAHSTTIDLNAHKHNLQGYRETLSFREKPKFHDEKNNGFIMSWKVEGSNDETKWTLIDEQKNSKDLCSFMAEGNWSCRKSKPFRFIRIMMTDKNSKGNYSMFLQAIELFGTIKYA